MLKFSAWLACVTAVVILAGGVTLLNIIDVDFETSYWPFQPVSILGLGFLFAGAIGGLQGNRRGQEGMLIFAWGVTFGIALAGGWGVPPETSLPEKVEDVVFFSELMILVIAMAGGVTAALGVRRAE